MCHENHENHENSSFLTTTIATYMKSWNALVFAPVFLAWFKALDARFPGSSARAVVSKVLANQALMALPINVRFLPLHFLYHSYKYCKMSTDELG